MSGVNSDIAGSAHAGAPGRRPRDLRLDFFRGLAMFIILLAHTPGNTWTLWIPARFGFSDATEIFVFCSGFASALAFGAVFTGQSWLLGAARISYRVWQVYWAHIGVFLATALLMVLIDWSGWGAEIGTYADWPSVVRLFTHTKETLVGLFTLSFTPGLFDILPMYLVILAMIPVVMLAHRAGGRFAVFALVIGVWLAAQLAGYARRLEGFEDPTALQAALITLGEPLRFMNLPGSPFNPNQTWFFNPFGWQLVFFAGFSFGMGWIPAPPVRGWLIALAAATVLIVVPFAWYKIHDGLYLPGDTALAIWIAETRALIEPLWWKSWQGIGRFAHFLALAYLAWVAVGPRGHRLNDGWEPSGPAPRAILALAAAVAVATIPYAYLEELKFLAPAVDAWFMTWVPILDHDRIGLLQLLHLVCVVVLLWAAIGPRGREWITRDMVIRAVPVIRKVGTQSLAVFMMSIALSRFNGFLLDIVGRDVWSRAAVNLWGFGVLIGTAYLVSWFKSQPWRARSAPAAAARSAEDASASKGAADGRGRPPMAAMRA